MEIQVVNFKPYSSGALVGFFDAAVGGLVVTGCKCFKKDDRIWFAWPAEKSQDKEGKDVWREIVSAAAPVMAHLQNAVRGQLRVLLDGVNGSESPPAAGRSAQRGFRTPEGEDLSEYRSTCKADDIPF
jgi:hypothetical protein